MVQDFLQLLNFKCYNNQINNLRIILCIINYLHVNVVGDGACVVVKYVVGDGACVVDVYVVGDGACVVDVYDVGVGDNVTDMLYNISISNKFYLIILSKIIIYI